MRTGSGDSPRPAHPAAASSQGDVARSQGLRLVLLLGLVSALGDVTYESARSVSGPYLALLGAGAGVIGLVSGAGEFVGYALRLATGYVADRTRSYWLGTFIGYGLLISIPLLALAHRWEVAALLLILERVGKAVRSPSRDAILSHATREMGHGWGFALHEALDQVGAVIGPLILAGVLALRGDYRRGFAAMAIPALLTVAVLSVAWRTAPVPGSLGALRGSRREDEAASVPRRGLWAYMAFAFLSVAGFAGFPLIAYHLQTEDVISAAQIPVLYAVAMGVDAGVALLAGKIYDRAGLVSLASIPLLSALVPVLAFSSRLGLAIAGIVLWGSAMAVHETTLRAAVADLSSRERRASAYGVLNTVYGAAWFVGNAAIGWLYGVSRSLTVAYVLVVEVLAVAALVVGYRALGARAGKQG